MLNLATNGNSPAHYAKGTQSPVASPKRCHRAPTACKCMVSGTFYSPNRGTFHLSVALLCTIGCQVVLSLGGWTPQLHTEFHELRATLDRRYNGGFRFCIQVFHLLWLNFPEHSVSDAFVTPYRCPQPQEASFLVWAISAFARRYLRSLG